MIKFIINAVKVNDLEKLLSEYPDKKTHVMLVIDPLDEESLLIVPLSLDGVTSYLPVSKLTISEWDYEEKNPQIKFTAD